MGTMSEPKAKPSKVEEGEKPAEKPVLDDESLGKVSGGWTWTDGGVARVDPVPAPPPKPKH
jgi:hypothetical protein